MGYTSHSISIQQGFAEGIVTGGVQGAHFRSHSFRMGAASTAFSLGVPVEVIKRMGRWRSDALLRYIRPFPGLGFLGNYFFFC